MRIPHEPRAIAPVCYVVGGDYRPLAAVCRRRLLAAPDLGLRNIRPRLGEPVLIQEDLAQSALPYEGFDFRESLGPIEVGGIDQKIAGPSHAEDVQEGKIIWITPYGRDDASSSEADRCPLARARAAPVRALQRVQHSGQRGREKNQQGQRDREMTNAEA